MFQLKLIQLFSSRTLSPQALFKAKNCDILCSLSSENNNCSKYSNFEKKVYKHLAQKNKTAVVPAKNNAPLKNTHPNKVNLALKEKRLQCKELTETKEKMNLHQNQ